MAVDFVYERGKTMNFLFYLVLQPKGMFPFVIKTYSILIGSLMVFVLTKDT